ncbi:MAG TPA: DNA recombination protein RmuC [Bryobacteraceae bacterium]|nr:DNA recombination protein RmuC [Bryobacteraceae bacterium]
MALLWFAAGILAGGILAGLWMRARMAEVLLAEKERKQPDLNAAVQPLSDAIGKLETHVRELDRAGQRMYGGIGEQIQALARETGTLSNALKSPQTRGRWGEITLRRVAELSGMVSRCDFAEQQTHLGDNGRIRPDMVVRLPGNRSIVVDAKTPLTGYLDAMGASEERVRRAALERHAQQLSEHVKHLSGKQYWAQFQPAPEMVVLFMPGDHFLAAALEARPALLEEALEKLVLIATPMTLVSILRGIAYGWNQVQLAENALEIREIASQFYDRLQTVWQHYAETGRQLEKTVACYNRSVGSWETRLMPAVRKMRDLGVRSEAEEFELNPIDLMARSPRPVETPYSQLQS